LEQISSTIDVLEKILKFINKWTKTLENENKKIRNENKISSQINGANIRK